MLDRDIEELAALVQKARRAVVFTGAGISTECGIPDFRSPGGFWSKHKPIEFGEFMSSEATRREAWTRFFGVYDSLSAAKPGPSHQAVAHWTALGHVATVVTQNIDGLHLAAGIPGDRIIEVHGNGTYATCLICGLRHELEWARAELLGRGVTPACVACGGVVKSATISFGQAMPEQAMADARAATLHADLFLALGSSLLVFPAAGLPVLAAHNQTPLIIVNRESTGLDGLADMVVNAELNQVLPQVTKLLNPI